MLRKIFLLSVMLQLLLSGVVAQGAVPEETRKMVRNLAGRWCIELSGGMTDYYDLVVTGDNSFILQYKFTKYTGSGKLGSARNSFNMRVEGDSLEGTHTYWVDFSNMGISVEEKTFPASGMMSNNWNTINITWDHPMPNPQDGGRWTDTFRGKVTSIFSRAR